MIAADAPPVAIDRQLALVIDDDDNVRESIKRTLGQLGMKVGAFQMAKEALASLDEGHPAIIFLDVALLRSDAVDVLRGLDQRHYGGIVQLMSGGRRWLLEAVQRIGVRHGIKLTAPLNKPLAPEVIAQLVEGLQSPRSANAG